MAFCSFFNPFNKEKIMSRILNQIKVLLLSIPIVVCWIGAAHSQVPPPPTYGELKGTVTDQAMRPITGIQVVVKPTVYAYGTHDFVGVTDYKGSYDIQGILRYVYSSGS